MKINSTQLRKIILQEMCDMHRDHDAHDELFNAVMQAAGGCPIKAGSILQGMMDRVSTHSSQDEPNPATSGEIPAGEELMGDEAYMEEKKVTAYDGPGHSKGILGPGFR